MHPAGDIFGFSGVAHRFACSQLTMDHDRETRDINTDAHWYNAKLEKYNALLTTDYNYISEHL